MPKGVNRITLAGRRVLALVGLVASLQGCSDAKVPPADDAGAGSAAAAGAATDAQLQRPRILVLVSLDTVRADVLGTYGYPRFTSPVLDGLASGGVVFEDASSTAPWTLPSHASMLTGLFPKRHGVTTMANRLPASVPTVAGILRGAGFETAAVVNSTWLKREDFAITRDFEKYLFVPEVADHRAPNTWVTDQAIEWLGEAHDRPLFLFVHYYDVHSDYASEPAYEKLFVRPYHGIADGTAWQLTRANLDESYLEMCKKEFDPRKCRFGGGATPEILDESVSAVHFDAKDVQHLKDLYDAGIRQLDTELGRLFARIGASDLRDETLVVVTSDHGEEFFEHGHVDHFLPTWQVILHVPLIFHGPGVPAGVRIATPVSSVDIVPTLLGLAGVKAPEGALDGLDLRPLWGADADRAAGPFAERFLYGEASGGLTYDRVAKGFYPIYRSVRRGRYKLVYESKGETRRLYDLQADPGEHEDVSATHPEVARQLGLEMDRRYAGDSGEAAPANDVKLSDEDRERLRALGYLK